MLVAIIAALLGLLARSGNALPDKAPDQRPTTAAIDDAPAADEHLATLSAVSVVAERRDEEQQKVPLALTALTDAFLHDAGVTHLADVQFFAPAFSFERNVSPFVTTFRIRGVANIANIPNFEPEVGLFYNSAYRPRSGLGDELLDVESIEILRGPQSVLYPMNVNGGLINIITRPPGDNPEAYAATDFGNYSEQELRAGVDGPLGASARGAIAVSSSHADGPFRDLVTQRDGGGGINSANGRAQLAIDLGDSAALRIVAGTSHRYGDCCEADVRPGPVSTALVEANHRAIDQDPFNRITTYDDPSHTDGTQSDVLADFSASVGSARFSSLTSFDRYEFANRFDLDETALAIGYLRDRQRASTFSQEVRLRSEATLPLEWMLGAYYYSSDYRRGSLDPESPLIILGPDVVETPLPGMPGDRVSFQSLSDTRQASAFGQIGWQVTPRLKVAGGARYVDANNTIDVRSAAQVAAPDSLALVLGVPAPVLAHRETNGIAWNLSAQYAATQALDFYAVIARGFKPGGFNGNWDASDTLTAARREFADERVLNTEAGLKGRFFDDRLSANLSVFDTRYDNFQNASFLGTNFLVRTAEKVRDTGVEFEGEARPLPVLLINYALEYLDLRYDRFTQGPCAFGITPTSATLGTCDLSGRDVPNAPHLRTVLGAQVEHELFDGTAYLRVDGEYTSAHLTDFALDPRSHQRAYSTFNLHLGWRGTRWSAALWCKNVTNGTSIVVSDPQNLFGGVDGGMEYFLADPRTFGVTIEYRVR